MFVFFYQKNMKMNQFDDNSIKAIFDYGADIVRTTKDSLFETRPFSIHLMKTIAILVTTISSLL